MCFSENISLAIGITGILSSFYFYKKNIYASIGIGYFALMEILQFFQYKVIDQCSNKYNKFLTNLGYIHICFQPVFANIWLSRLFFVKDDELCDNKNEPLCGKKTCSFSGNKHIAWNLRLRAPGKHWFTPRIGLHFFMWVIPVLTIVQLKPILALILTGPYLGILLTNNIHEQPAIWCYTSIGQMLVTYYFLK